MQLTYFGQNLAGVQRFHIRMASKGKSWFVARMDSDGNWMTNDEQALEVTLTPTILNVLSRLSTLETSYANVNAAIQYVQETERKLTERVATLEAQSKQQSEYVFNLVSTQQQQCADAVNKAEAMFADM